MNSDERMALLTFASVYPHYVNKITKKGRTVQELHQVITWLTGFDENDIQTHIHSKINFEEFFSKATLPVNVAAIKGVICGYRVEEITNPLSQKVRYLDKIVDELAKGWALSRIFRAK